MGPNKTANVPEETSTVIYPIQFVSVGKLQNVPAPLVRIRTCGGIHLEVLQEVIYTDPPQGRYQIVTLHNRPKGSSTGLTLLKILASLPEHYASKDWLTEHLPRTRSTEDDDEQGWGQGLIRIDNVVYLLRGLLCPAGIAGEEILRKLLVTYIRNHRESGPGYRLAADPLVWLDVDVIATSVKQALLLEQEEKESVLSWEQVYALASKGAYLPDELYSDWAKDTRLRMEGYARQAVHALRRLYLAHNGEGGEEQAIVLLRSYWQTHPLDEDMLRSLLELLGKHNILQEALDCYQYLCNQLEQEGRTPDPRTQKTILNLRIGQSTYNHLIEVRQPLKDNSILPSSPQDKAYDPFSSVVPQGIIDADNMLEKATHQLENQEMESSRRNLLKQTIPFLFGISDALLHASFDAETEERLLQFLLDSSSVDDKTITKFEKITANCWLLLRVDGLSAVEQLLPTYLPRFASFLRRPSQYQQRAASIAAQGYILQGLVAVLNSNPVDSERFCEQAVFYARLAKDRNLEAATLKHLATKFLDNGYPLRALQTYQEVLPFIKEVSPLLQGRTYLGLSLTYARINQENKALHYLDQAYASFPDDPERDFSFSYADCHLSSLHHYAGLILAEFGRFEKARTIFAQVEELSTRYTIPERTRIEIMNCQAEVSLALKDLRSSRDLIEKSVAGALHLKSEKRYNDALALYKQARLLFPQEGLVKDLADLFIR